MFSRNRTKLEIPVAVAYPCMTEKGCPEAELKPGTPGFCPAWQSGSLLTETNIVTGEEAPVRGCFYRTIPRLMIHVIQASNRPAAEIGAMRSEVVEGVRNQVEQSMNGDNLLEILQHIGVTEMQRSLGYSKEPAIEDNSENQEESKDATGFTFNITGH